MKTIGLIGGMSWESTVPYYAMINEAVRARLGGLHSARILLYSVEFAEIERMQHEGRWEDAGAVLADVARRLEGAGADFLVLCTNTMHLVAPHGDRVVDRCAGRAGAVVRHDGVARGGRRRSWRWECLSPASAGDSPPQYCSFFSGGS